MNRPEDVVLAEIAEPTKPPAVTRTSIVELMLRPESIQRMMQLGGGVLVLGFVVWLWSIGLFENPLVVACMLGGLTLSVLGAGVALVRYTRYQLAGTGLTLLAALAMVLARCVTIARRDIPPKHCRAISAICGARAAMRFTMS